MEQNNEGLVRASGATTQDDFFLNSTDR